MTIDAFLTAAINGAHVPNTKDMASGELHAACLRLRALKPPIDRVFPTLDHIISQWPVAIRPNIVDIAKNWSFVNEKPLGADDPVMADAHGAAIVNPGSFPDHLLNTTGILKLWTDWINETSFMRQPVLALAAVIPACGALIGRRLQTKSKGRANIYVLGLAETGRGKERARQAVKEVMVASGADDLLGGEDFASDAGIVSSLTTNACQLYQVDEIGKLLRAITDTNAPGHLTGIVSLLLKLYSSANSIFKAKLYADTKRNPVIIEPHVCLYGTAVPAATWEALGAASVDDGLLARLWAFCAADGKPERQDPEMTAPPVALVDAIQKWRMSDKQSAVGSIKSPQSTIVPRTPEALEVFQGFIDLADREEAALKDNPLAKLWTRAAQKADQLALVWAWSDSETPIIDETCAKWAVGLAAYLTRSMIWHASRFLAHNQVESDVKRVLRIVQDAGKGGISRRDLTRRTQWLPEKTRTSVIDGLKESEQLTEVIVHTTGRSRICYHASLPEGASV